MVYGAPEKVYVTLGFAADTASISADVRWINKQWTRLPGASLLMLPISRGTGGGSWEVDKLGSWVDTADVVPAGGAARACDPDTSPSCVSKTPRAIPTTTPSNRDVPDISVGSRWCMPSVGLDSALFSVGPASPFPTPLNPSARRSPLAY